MKDSMALRLSASTTDGKRAEGSIKLGSAECSCRRVPDGDEIMKKTAACHEQIGEPEAL